MTPEVQAVVVYDGQVLMVDGRGGWGLPTGAPEPAESPEATAARVVYELTGYLVDGTQSLGSAHDVPTVVCQLLTQDPSDGATLAPERMRWTPVATAADAGLPAAVRTYLLGHRRV
ncbi:NUDIX domain-containing protein [Streptomyces sp. NPDC003635]